ncbi:MAG: general secretion pathway protein GspK [Desulfobulbaceae bacterium]|nr:general secretion pathway protein GspK [Desulfobulbaceae bacterium]
MNVYDFGARLNCRHDKVVTTDNGKQKGFALVVVIMIMLMVSFLAAQLILSVRTNQQIAFHAKARAIGLCLAQGGLNLGIFRLLDKPLEEMDVLDEALLLGYPYDALLANGKIDYYVVNESGKIDLNKLNKPLINLFLDYLAVEEEQKAIIVDSLLDWRDSNDLHRLNGAEGDYYEALDDPYLPRNGPLKDPTEFFLVKGTEELTGRFKASDVFTVHNSKGRINFNSLTPFMLDFLTEEDEEKKEAYREAQETHATLTAALARNILGNERFDACSSSLTYEAGGNKYYSIVARGGPGRVEAGEEEEEFHAEGVETEVRVMFERRGNRIRYLSWQES